MRDIEKKNECRNGTHCDRILNEKFDTKTVRCCFTHMINFPPRDEQVNLISRNN
jgi:hypothetical protein